MAHSNIPNLWLISRSQLISMLSHSVATEIYTTV